MFNLKNVLDIGGGDGLFCRIMRDHFINCFSQDKFSKNIYAQHFEKPKFDNADLLTSFEVIEHLSNESGVTFYYDSLKDDGILAVSVPNKWWIFETHGAKLPLLPWNRVPFFSWLPKPIHERFAHARIYTKKRIRKLLEKHGFSVLYCKYITAPMDVLLDGELKNWVIKNIFNTDTTSIPFKATSIFVVAKKKVKTATNNV